MAIWLFFALAVLASTPLVTPWFWSALKHKELDSTKIAKTFTVDILASAVFMWIVTASSNDYTFFGCLYFIAIVVGISQFANVIYYYDDENNEQKSFIGFSLLFSVLCIVFVVAVMVISGIYNSNNPENLNINKYEQKLAIQDVDITTTLKELGISSNYTLNSPIQRNGNWVYYLIGGGDTPGYVLVNPSGEARFIEKTILYKPGNKYFRATRWEAFKALPGKIFWSWSMQWNPETNELFNVATYGHQRFLRAGRVVEGLVEVSLHTGAVKTYSLEELPNYLSNYSD